MRFSLKCLRFKMSLAFINVSLLTLNFFMWNIRTEQEKEPSLVEVEINHFSRSIYEHVRDLPGYQGNGDGVRRWSRSKVTWKDDHLDWIMKGAMKNKRRRGGAKLQVPNIGGRKEVDCRKLLNGDPGEIQRSVKFMEEHPKFPIQEESYLEWTKNCSKFRTERGYVEVPLSVEEENFPLAFSISTYTDIEQTERLLRAIYQPQNFYCIHADLKSPLMFHQAVQSIARCFDNVWVATRLHKVKWGDSSVIMPEMSCLSDLLKYYRGQYKYFINLTGQEFPLRTNSELVRIGKIFNGSNDITGSRTRMETDRVRYIWSHRWSKTYQQTILYNTGVLKEPYQFSNLTFFKGETHGFFSSAMTEYLLESLHGRAFFEWCKDTGHASEHYWNTLNYNKHLKTPGGYIGDLRLADQYSVHPAIRAKNWVNLYDAQWPCHGKVVRGVCIFGVKDVVWLARRPEMFVNKFHLTFEYIGYDCLEELHRNRTAKQSLSTLDVRYYEGLPTVKYARKYDL